MNPATSSSPIALDTVRARFDALLRDAATPPQSPALGATWQAFTQFACIEVACDEESLFFECGPSPLDESRFYVNFTRTFFGRDAGNHFWSSELNCDFLFENTEALEELGVTIEAEEFNGDAAACAAFFAQANAQNALWDALRNRESLSSTILFRRIVNAIFEKVAELLLTERAERVILFLRIEKCATFHVALWPRG